MRIVRHLLPSLLVGSTLACLLVATGCDAIPGGDGDGDGDGGDGDCAEDMTVSAGLTPDFTWEGGPAAGLAVAEYPEGANRQWVLAMAAATGFDSPVTYGTVPANALEAEGAAQDLVAGTEYSVTVTLSNGVDIRCQLFTP